MENLKNITVLSGTAKRKSCYDCKSDLLKGNLPEKPELLQNITFRDFDKLRNPRLFVRKKLTTRSNQILSENLKPYTNILLKENVLEIKESDKNFFSQNEIIRGGTAERKMKFIRICEETSAIYSSFRRCDFSTNFNDGVIELKKELSNSFNFMPASDTANFYINYKKKMDFSIGVNNFQKTVSSNDFIQDVLSPEENLHENKMHKMHKIENE